MDETIFALYCDSQYDFMQKGLHVMCDQLDIETPTVNLVVHGICFTQGDNC